MLSRLALRSGALAPMVIRQVTQNPSTFLVARSSSSISKHVENWEKANKIYYGPDRDTKNFPAPTRPDSRPPTRMGIFPESWFTFFYEKTGVTGPYVFGAGAITFMLSKEIWVVEHGFTEFVAFWLVFAWSMKKFGPAIGKYIDGVEDEYMKKRWEEPIAQAKSGANQMLTEGETVISQQDGQKFLYEAKRENVDLQLEARYRERLVEAHQAVKKRLDYHCDMETAKRNFEQNHMVNWIVDSVVKGITPQQEKESLSKCIQDLKSLSAAKA